MVEVNLPGLSDSVTKALSASAGKPMGLESLSEHILKIQGDSLLSTQSALARIAETYQIPTAASAFAKLAADCMPAIPKFDLPVSTIAAMQNLQQSTAAALQAAMPDLSKYAVSLGESMRRFQVVASFLKCCETTYWPVYFIASAEMEEDLAHYQDTFEAESDLAEAVNEYAIDFLDANKINEILSSWLDDKLVSEDKKPLLECAINHHLNKDYFASTSILMCLVEGLIEDCDSEFHALASCDDDGLEYVARHLGLNDGIANRRSKGYAKDQLAAITYGVESGIYYWEASAKYIATITLANKPDIELYESNPFRNKICHGSQVNHGTIVHSLKSILVIDLLIRLGRSFRNNSNN